MRQATTHCRMRSGSHVLVVWSLLTLFTFASSQTPVASMPRIAVLGFEVSDVSGRLPEPVRVDMGIAMSAAMEVPLVQSRRFTVVTRVDLEKVLDEVALGAAGVLDPAQAREFGRVAGVDVIVTGTITIIAEENYSVTARFIDTETGRISDSATVSRVAGADGFAGAGSSFVERVLERYPLQGVIVAIEGGSAFVDVGSERGLAGVGGEGVIFRVREVAGRAFPVDVGTFRVLQVAEDLSLIAPSLVAGEELLVGDRVRFGSPVSSAEPSPRGAAEASPPSVAAASAPAVAEGEPASVVGAVGSGGATPLVQGSLEGLSTGSLWISGSPPSAVVLVDRVLVGDLALGSLDVHLPAGDVVVRVEADGFVAEERSVRIEAGVATRVVAELVALPDAASSGADSRDGVVDQPGGVAGAAASGTARVVLSVQPPDARVLVDGVVRGHVFDLLPGRYSLVVRAAGHVEEAMTLVVEGSETVERVVVLRREEATLVLAVTPAEARVLLDGGELVERELLLRPGIYQLRVEAPGWVAFERRVVLPAARVERVTVALEPLRGGLMLDVQPPEASVSVDGVDFEGRSLSLPVGVRRVTIAADGYEPVSFEVEITTGGVERRSVQLVARPARVTLRVTPTDATVTVNGQPHDATFELPAGLHELVVSHPGHAEQRLSLNLAPGEHIERDVALTRLVAVSFNLTPATARVTIDGAAVSFPLLLAPGEYAVVVSTRYVEQRFTLVVPDNRAELFRTVVLTPAVVTIDPNEPAQVTKPAQPAEPERLQPVRTELETYTVNEVTRADGTREDRFSPATQARRGQVVEYRIIVNNVSLGTVPPGVAVITVPVLEGTQFLPNSATPSSEDLLTEFSADRGMTFAEGTVFVGLGNQRTIADPTDYTTVRWTVLKDMEPGEVITLVYRVTLR